MRHLFFLILFLTFTGEITSQTANDILNILVQKNTISQNTADSLRAEYSINQYNSFADNKFPIDAEYRPRTEFLNVYHLFQIQPLSSKIDVRADFHTFYLQQDYYSINDLKIDRYLGFENDFLLTYKPNAVTKVDLGVSYMLPTETFETVKNSGNSKYNLTWVYLSLTFRPQLLSLSFK